MAKNMKPNYKQRFKQQNKDSLLYKTFLYLKKLKEGVIKQNGRKKKKNR